ncbi:MAG TPA: PIN domain-containing protein, partial [Solirubrobacterales bacterium]|nr:PIN domain-containing protein [Solirubrobacterales bacterium]
THPVDARVARELGRLQAAIATRGGKPRGRTADLIIAATALAHDAVLFTRNYKDFKLVDDLVDVREPPS